MEYCHGVVHMMYSLDLRRASVLAHEMTLLEDRKQSVLSRHRWQHSPEQFNQQLGIISAVWLTLSLAPLLRYRAPAKNLERRAIMVTYTRRPKTSSAVTMSVC